MLNITALKDDPKLHLHLLLEALSLAPDGHRTTRQSPDAPQPEDVWELDAGGYSITVQPDHICGFSEEGDGKVLTAIAARVAENNGGLVLNTTRRLTPADSRVPEYIVTEWMASVRLGPDMPLGSEAYECPREGRIGVGWSAEPGTAVLAAYLRAWGVAE